VNQLLREHGRARDLRRVAHQTNKCNIGEVPNKSKPMSRHKRRSCEAIRLQRDRKAATSLRFAQQRRWTNLQPMLFVMAMSRGTAPDEWARPAFSLWLVTSSSKALQAASSRRTFWGWGKTKAESFSCRVDASADGRRSAKCCMACLPKSKKPWRRCCWWRKQRCLDDANETDGRLQATTDRKQHASNESTSEENSAFNCGQLPSLIAKTQQCTKFRS